VLTVDNRQIKRVNPLTIGTIQVGEDKNIFLPFLAAVERGALFLSVTSVGVAFVKAKVGSCQKSIECRPFFYLKAAAIGSALMIVIETVLWQV
jgi:hypothetical protein